MRLAALLIAMLVQRSMQTTLLEYFCANDEGTKMFACPNGEVVGEASVCESRLHPGESCERGINLNMGSVAEQRKRALNCKAKTNCTFNINSWISRKNGVLDGFKPDHFAVAINCFQVKEMCKGRLDNRTSRNEDTNEGFIGFDKSEGFVVSPWYPNGYGMNSVDQCSETITLKGHLRISLLVMEFTMPKRVFCGNDRLEVYGRGVNQSSWIRICSWCGFLHNESSSRPHHDSVKKSISFRRNHPSSALMETPYNQLYFVLTNRRNFEQDNVTRKFKIMWNSSPIFPTKFACSSTLIPRDLPKPQILNVKKMVTSTAVGKSHIRLIISVLCFTITLAITQCFIILMQLRRVGTSHLWIQRILGCFGFSQPPETFKPTAQGLYHHQTGVIGSLSAVTSVSEFKPLERMLRPEDMQFKTQMPKDLLDVQIYGAEIPKSETIPDANLSIELKNQRCKDSKPKDLCHFVNDDPVNIIGNCTEEPNSLSDVEDTVKLLLMDTLDRMDKMINGSINGTSQAQSFTVRRAFNPLSVISKSPCPYRISRYI